MSDVTLIIDGTEIKAQQGEKLLWAALDNGFYIPNLCAVKLADKPPSSCRLCFVEVEGKAAPVTSCTEPVSDGMVVHLNTPRVQKLRNSAFEFLLSHHNLDCRNCARNGSCELQYIASHTGLKLKLRRLEKITKELPVDSSHPLFTYDPNQCVLCGKCVWACNQQGAGILDFAFRGINTRVSTIDGIPIAEAGCTGCLVCVAVCPVGSMVAKPGVDMEKARALAIKVLGR